MGSSELDLCPRLCHYAKLRTESLPNIERSSHKMHRSEFLFALVGRAHKLRLQRPVLRAGQVNKSGRSSGPYKEIQYSRSTYRAESLPSTDSFLQVEAKLSCSRGMRSQQLVYLLVLTLCAASTEQGSFSTAYRSRQLQQDGYLGEDFGPALAAQVSGAPSPSSSPQSEGTGSLKFS